MSNDTCAKKRKYTFNHPGKKWLMEPCTGCDEYQMKNLVQIPCGNRPFLGSVVQVLVSVWCHQALGFCWSCCTVVPWLCRLLWLVHHMFQVLVSFVNLHGSCLSWIDLLESSMVPVFCHFRSSCQPCLLGCIHLELEWNLISCSCVLFQNCTLVLEK